MPDEENKESQEPTPKQPEPVLSMDDLILEIGAQHVRLLEASKKQAQSDVAIKKLFGAIDKAKQIQAENEELKKRNMLLGDKYNQLADGNADLSSQLQAMTDKRDTLAKEIARRDKISASKKRTRG